MGSVWRVQEAIETGVEGSESTVGRDETRERTGQGIMGGLTGYPEDHSFS